MAHVRTNHTMSIKPNSRIIHTNLLVLPGTVPDNCIVLGMDNCPVDVNVKQTAAAAWWRLHRGVVDCSVGDGVAAGEYTIRKKYFRGAVNNNADVFIQKIVSPYVSGYSNTPLAPQTLPRIQAVAGTRLRRVPPVRQGALRAPVVRKLFDFFDCFSNSLSQKIIRIKPRDRC